jgi:hypothetical protein
MAELENLKSCFQVLCTLYGVEICDLPCVNLFIHRPFVSMGDLVKFILPDNPISSRCISIPFYDFCFSWFFRERVQNGKTQ